MPYPLRGALFSTPLRGISFEKRHISNFLANCNDELYLQKVANSTTITRRRLSAIAPKLAQPEPLHFFQPTYSFFQAITPKTVVVEEIDPIDYLKPFPKINMNIGIMFISAIPLYIANLSANQARF